MIYFVMNKYSGSYSEAIKSELEKYAEKMPGTYTITYTLLINGIPVPDIKNGVPGDGDIICAVGGDGTVNTCLQYIHDNGLQDKVLLGVIPMGTGNNLIRSLNLSKNLARSVEIISERKSEKISYGTIDGRVFFNCSFGFTSHVLKNRRTNSVKGYFYDAARLLPAYRACSVRFDETEDPVKIFAGFFINTSFYMSRFRFLKNNNSDKELVFYYIEGGRKFKAVKGIMDILTGRASYKTMKKERYTLTLPPGCDIEIDGDLLNIGNGGSPVEIGNFSRVEVIKSEK